MNKKFICKECGKKFEVTADEIKFEVCPGCGTDDIDHAKETTKEI